MKNLLVPIDFSETSKDAFLFAQDIAVQFDSTVHLVHVAHPSFDPSQPGIVEPLLGYEEVKQKLLDDFIKENVRDGADVEADVIMGFAVDEIVRLSREDKYDLIIMGTRGEHDIADKIMGSISSSVSLKAYCPVLLVPKGLRYTRFQQILYASSYESADEDCLHRIIAFAKLFKAGIHFVHVSDPDDDNSENLERALFEELFEDEDPDFSFTIAHIRNETVIKGLEKYASENDIDLIAMVTRHRNFWQKILQKSLTKKIVLSTKFPLMIYHVD